MEDGTASAAAVAVSADGRKGSLEEAVVAGKEERSGNSAMEKNVGGVPKKSHPSTQPTPVQGSFGQGKSKGIGSDHPSNKNHNFRHHRIRPKYFPSLNVAPALGAPFPYYQHLEQPMYPLVPSLLPPPPPPMRVYEYASQNLPTRLPGMEPSMPSEMVMTGYTSTDWVGAYGSQCPQGPRLAPKNFHLSVDVHSRPQNSYEASGHFKQACWNQRPQIFGDNVKMHHGIRPWDLINSVPPIYGPSPGLINGPSYPVSPPPMYYIPAAPPYMPSGPPPFPYASTPRHPGHYAFTPEEQSLRADIVRQVEYYFSDENLPTDGYLLSLLDSEGWVSISKVAEFRMLKGITRSIPLILDALQSSKSIEVQGEKIRRRGYSSMKFPAPGQRLQSSTFKSTLSASDKKAYVSLANDNIDGMDDRVISEDSLESGRGQDESWHLRDNSTKFSLAEALTSDDTPKRCGESEDGNKKSASGSSSEMEAIEPGRGCGGTLEKDLGCSLPDIKSTIFDLCGKFESSQGTSCLHIGEDSEPKNAMVLSDLETVKQTPSDFSNGSGLKSPSSMGEQSTVVLDKELELGDTTQIEHLPVHKRNIDESRDVHLLSHAMQDVTLGNDRTAGVSDPFPDEVSVDSNDGLYISGQAKQCSDQGDNSGAEIIDGDLSAHSLANFHPNLMVNADISGKNSSEDAEHANPQSRQNKDATKLQSSHKQLLIPSDLKYVGNDCMHCGIVQESPPNNSVCFSFGSVPAGSNNFMH